MASPEPRNPFYFLLLAVSMVFVATALAYGILPQIEDNAASAGHRPSISPFRAALRKDGAQWLLYEVAAIAVVVVLCLGLDWWRSPRNAVQGTVTPTPPVQEPPPPA
jgi:hypothetical protein